MWVRVVVGIVLLVLPTALCAQAEKRVALVIGNSAYKHTPKLANPSNDAADMAAALKKHGFKVFEGVDLDKPGFDRKVRDFATALKGSEVGVFFYAGHGLQVAGQNYLVPIDAKAEGIEALDFEMVRVDVIHRLMERQTDTNILFLDACRDNPLARNLARSMGTRSAEIGRGLAAVESGIGTLISFSTQPGNVALDGSGRNSPFAGALLKQLSDSNDDLSGMLIAVRNDVMKETKRRQVPWEHSALTGRFYFSAAAPRVSQAPSSQLAAVPPPSAPRAPPSVEPAATVTPLPPPARCDGVETLVGSERRCLKPGDSFKDCPDCPEMVVVPAGEFMMGSPQHEPGRNDDENPQRQVRIPRSFALGRFEITFAEWDWCLANRGCTHRPDDHDWGRGKKPVMNVSWLDVTSQFVPWMSRKTGKSYRLPTEAEWEYAARAGTSTAYAFGNSISDAQARFVSIGGLSQQQAIGSPIKYADVGSLIPNAFGLHDMHGNISEHVQDCYASSYSGAPTDGSAVDLPNCTFRVGRGGAWVSYVYRLRSAARGKGAPNERAFARGFRIARTLD